MVKIVKDPKVALLNGPVAGVHRHTHSSIYFMFLAAKIAIATAWKKTTVDLAVMSCKLTWIMTKEKWVSILRDASFQFQKSLVYIDTISIIPLRVVAVVTTGRSEQASYRSLTLFPPLTPHFFFLYFLFFLFLLCCCFYTFCTQC